MPIRSRALLVHLYTACEIFGIIAQSNSNRLPFRLLNASLVALMLTGLTLYIRYVPVEMNIYCGLEVGIYCTNTVGNTLMVLATNLNCKKLVDFFGEFDKVEFVGLSSTRQRVVYYAEVVSIGLLSVPYYVYCLEQYHLLVGICQILHLVQMTLNVLLVYNLALVLRNKFGALNARLRRRGLAEAERISLVYGDLCDLVDEISEVFGIKILVVFLVVLLNLVKCINFAINYFYLDVDITLEKLFRRIFIKALLILVFTILIAVSCGQASREAGRTKLVCLELLKLCSQKTLLDESVRTELEDLLRLVKFRRPIFTACDLFTVDYPVLLSLLSFVTTYTILVVEIKQNFKFSME